MNSGKRVMLSVVSVAISAASIIGCATSAAADAHSPVPGVATICRNVMGLSPTERLRGGNWLGNDKLDYWTSHYRGCLVSLSDSLQGATDIEVVQQAEERCRTQGLLPGSPDLALCVLQSANQHPEPTHSQSANQHPEPIHSQSANQHPEPTHWQSSLQATGTEPETAPGSFYFASSHEIARRERVACTALGLSPTGAEYGRCVQQLRATFYAVDHPID